MKNRKIILMAVVMTFVMCMALGLSGCGGSADSSSADGSGSSGSAVNPGASATSEEPVDSSEPMGIHHAEIEIADYGTVKVELDGDTAPITVRNFIYLANAGFYDGLTFHRIIDGFMIQGGDPNGDGTGGSDKNIKGEFASNGVENNISHKKGVISMARSQDPDSASSQFFIMVEDGNYLDGEYAAFGHVTEGQEIVDKIAKDAKPLDENGTVAKEDQPVITTIKVID